MIKRCYECLHWRKGISTELWGKCIYSSPERDPWGNMRGVFLKMHKDDVCGQFDGKGLGSEMYGYNRLTRTAVEDQLKTIFGVGGK